MQIPLTLKSLLNCISLSLLCFASKAQDRYWQQDLEYHISVNLNDTDHSLDGFLKLRYTNNSPDTLRYIWFHLWPNAYKTDRTAFSDQLLENGRTDFYFADNEKRGYINRLDFRVNDSRAETEDHPEHIDIIKVVLPSPLPPTTSVVLTTPFHVQLPYIFSRSGFDGKAYQITQWYPKPAVYDASGWHPMPYLDQGEFYDEFGSYEVQITLPADYIVAATGTCENEQEATTGSPGNLKTIRYSIDSVHDFAFFADKRFLVSKDSLQLPDGRLVQTRVFSLPKKKGKSDAWTNAQAYLKKSIQYHSANTGPYPYAIVSVVEGKQGFEGGMEYPTITILNGAEAGSLEELIVHEVGHNWFQGILATNERQNPWMDEGLNSYFDQRYLSTTKTLPPTTYHQPPSSSILWKTLASVHLDQPIATPSDSFNTINYNLVAYQKSADWFLAMEQSLGRDRFDSCIKAYYAGWQFKHPQEKDLLRIFREAGGTTVEPLIRTLQETGAITQVQTKGLQVKLFGSVNNTEKTNHLFIAPTPGYNMYDGLMLGVTLHNYTLPLPRFRYAISPLYAFRSKQLNGIANLNYSIYPSGKLQEIRFMLDAASFSMDDFDPENGPRISQRFTKLSPGLRLEWKNRNARQTVIKHIQYKSFFIGEEALRFSRDTIAGETLVRKEKTNYAIHQLSLGWENYRALYPWKTELRGELGNGFGRLSFTGNYFFNFRKKGGVALRMFAGKFFYTDERTNDKVFETDRFHLNMSGPKGYEDYTYSNYFVGRNAFEGFPSQQIMIRDGAFKVRTDLLSQKVGKTDNWLLALNAVLDVPDKLNILNALPVKIPLRIFADVGTYAEAWDPDNGGARILFDAGLQFSFFKNTVHLYMPLLYSKAYRDYFKSTPGNGFLQRMSFSMDLHLINLKKTLHSELR